MAKVKLFSSDENISQLIPPGEVRQIQISGHALCAAMGSEGLVVFEPGCPHLGHPLKNSWLNPYNEIVCELHTYRFNLKTGEESQNRCRSLKTFPINQTAEGYFVEI